MPISLGRENHFAFFWSVRVHKGWPFHCGFVLSLCVLLTDMALPVTSLALLILHQTQDLELFQAAPGLNRALQTFFQGLTLRGTYFAPTAS